MSQIVRRHRLRNLVRSALLLLALGSMLVLVGWLLGGPEGILLTFVAAVALALFAPSISVERLLRQRGARRLSAPWLEGAVSDLTRRAGLAEPPALFVVPAAEPQALTASGPEGHMLALSPRLLQLLDPRELTAVVAHEISHLRHRDLGWMRIAEIVRSLTRTSARIGLLLLLFNLPLMLFAGAHVPWLGVLLLVGASWAVNLLTLALSRAREYDADAGAVELTGDPLALASALEKIERAARPSWLSFFQIEAPSRWRTHPSTRERVARLREMANPRPPRGPRRSSVRREEGRRVLIPEWRRAR